MAVSIRCKSLISVTITFLFSYALTDGSPIQSIQQVKHQLKNVLENIRELENQYEVQAMENRACEQVNAGIWDIKDNIEHLEERVEGIPNMLQEFKDRILMCLMGPMPDCHAYIQCSKHSSGIYDITPPGRPPVSVYCDMTSEGGGWTVIQRRVDNTTDFNRTYQEYQVGFGNPDGNFWIGLDNIHTLTEPNGVELQINLGKADGQSTKVVYNYFHIGSKDEGYILMVDGYEGTAGDSLVHHNGSMFSTWDMDQDLNPEGNCGHKWHSGWWFRSCYWVNLNGVYQEGQIAAKDPGIKWFEFTGLESSLMHTVMMIRRKNV